MEDVVTDKITMVPGIDHTVETGTKIAIGEEEITTTEMVTGITGLIIGIAVGPEIETITEMATGIIIDQIIEGKTVTKGMAIGIRTVAGSGTEIEIGGIAVALGKVSNPEAVVDPKTGMRIEGRVEMIPQIGTDLNQDQNPLLA